MTPLDFNGVSCVDGNDFHFANSWFRSFHLPDYGHPGPVLRLPGQPRDRVRRNTAGGVGQPMTVNLYTNSGLPLPRTETLTPIGSATRHRRGPGAHDPRRRRQRRRRPADLGPRRRDRGSRRHRRSGRVLPRRQRRRRSPGPSYLYEPDCGDLDARRSRLDRVSRHAHHPAGRRDRGHHRADGGSPSTAAGDGVITLGEQVDGRAVLEEHARTPLTLSGTASNLTGPGRPDLHAGRRHGRLRRRSPSAPAPTARTRPATATRSRSTAPDSGTAMRRFDETPLLVAAPGAPQDASLPRTRGAPRRPELRGRRARKPLLPVHRDASPQRRHGRMRHARLVLPGQHHAAQADGGVPPEGPVRLLLRPAARRSASSRTSRSATRSRPWIEDLANRNITSGCGAGIYCPDDLVQRKQMAVFLLKTLLGLGLRCLRPRPESSTTFRPTASGPSSRTSTTAASPEAARADRPRRRSPTAPPTR